MSVTGPSGFRAAGVTAGLKASGRPDIALVVNDGPDHHAAAVFTSNRVEAAPVTWSRQVVTDGRADAVVLNAGARTPAPGPRGSPTRTPPPNRSLTCLAAPPVTSSSAPPG